MKKNICTLGLLFLSICCNAEISVQVFNLIKSTPTSITATAKIEPLKLEMIEVKGGKFSMGAKSIESEFEAQIGEKPIHDVVLNSFLLGRTELTQALWKFVMDSNPSHFKGDSLPVENVSWNAVQEFIVKLNSMTGKSFRLPTEAEWEYAAGEGTYKGRKYSGTDNDSELGDYAWYEDNSNYVTHAVATKKPNALGLYDMSGNVWEWCSDWLGKYSTESQSNPIGPSSGIRRTDRGGSYRHEHSSCRTKQRGGYAPISFNNRIGFRLVLNSEK